MAPIRVQLVSDDQMLADALTWRLAQEPDGFQVTHSPGVVARALEALNTQGADVLVIDAGSVAGHWTMIADAVIDTPDDLLVAILSDTTEAEDAILAAMRHVSAWLPPTATADHVIEVLRAVVRGHVFYPPDVLGAVLRRLVDGVPDRRPGSGPLTLLTERERDVLVCLVEGRHGQEIAERLDIAANTVRSHTNRILRKLGVHSRLEAVRVARENGFESRAVMAAGVATVRRVPQSDQTL
ncbi:response regulator transcription factor [Actinomycetospora endophytica]|uniref:Response regulator transcription factor n=1 Tax=Actinomycetospora endophytica TaxID=2291215 RepID=A0ABS8PCU8_9PSEU|nr:response regulator transcription factor [Actinomycetospora endophytica]MCD2196105.1 response regulator transcription factor [Actinomycetospora endophytica]